MKRFLWFLALTLSMLLPAPAAQAAWIWSPQTGWIGPSGAVKDTPQEQLAHAMGFFERKEYPRARKEFQKLVKAYKDSREASDAQFHIGRSLEEEGDYYGAFKAYRKMVQTYPASARFTDALGRMYQIGNHFLSGKKRTFYGIAEIIPAKDKAVEAFETVVEEGPFSEHGELAQYKLGLAHLSLGSYEQAVTAFEGLIERYPNSTLLDDARFQLAQASLKGTFRPGYDQFPTDRAIEELEQFVREYPSSPLSSDAVERIRLLRERRAEHDFNVALFYEARKAPDSALIYYEGIVDRFADTSWASKALARMDAIRPSVQ